jgi:hypothetical protein
VAQAVNRRNLARRMLRVEIVFASNSPANGECSSRTDVMRSTSSA